MTLQRKWTAAKAEYRKRGARGVAMKSFDALDRPLHLRRVLRFVPPAYTRARALADIDRAEALAKPGRRFTSGTRPVIRWCKGDGLDDDVTRSAIGQATSIFGAEVDYCLCTNGIDAARARRVLSWASQPVEWWPVSPTDNAELARVLAIAGCSPDRYGYWWKWFPFRTRPAAPEWILDGDMVITARPAWFDDWARGTDVIRLSQEVWNPGAYGTYGDLVDPALSLNSGLASLPPHDSMGAEILAVLAERPLPRRPDGRHDMCEQGVVAAAFQRLGVTPIPLREFPFASSDETEIERGPGATPGEEWGFHFIRSFVRPNAFFEQLVADGTILSVEGDAPMGGFAWLGGSGQWGVPGWAMNEPVADIVFETARAFAGRPVLEMGTSRGRVAALLASAGCVVTTVDHQDRGAAKNLEGLSATVVVADANEFLRTTEQTFDLIVVDLHGNGVPEWQERAELLLRPLAVGGTLVVSNTQLHKQELWRDERGARWFVDRLAPSWDVQEYDVEPGLAVLRRKP